jgi:hypothetical protein
MQQAGSQLAISLMMLTVHHQLPCTASHLLLDSCWLWHGMQRLPGLLLHSASMNNQHVNNPAELQLYQASCSKA